MRSAVKSAVDEFNQNTGRKRHERTTDACKFSWDTRSHLDADRKKTYTIENGQLTVASYRPFFKQRFYFSRDLNNTTALIPYLYPTLNHPNYGFYQVGSGSAVPFSVLILDKIPDMHVTGAGSGGQFFARWRYEKAEPPERMLAISTPDESGVIDGYRRIDNITDEALSRFTAAFGESITKDDIFAYVYGLLHAPDYRETYAADLKKALPRIPLVKDREPYIAAGRALSELHLGYEQVEPYPLRGLIPTDVPTGDAAYEFYRVRKMAFAKRRDTDTKKLVTDRSSIVYNPRITLTGIPEEAYRYMLGSRSAIEWIIDRYQVKTDKPSGIVNDPNDWSREVDDPRYILDLLARIVTVSLETMKIVDALPVLDIRAVR